MLTPIEVLPAIMRERDYQDRKWGPITTHGHTVGEWLLIIERELDEAKQGWIHGRGDADALRELVQVMAVTMACLQQHGVVERDSAARQAQEG